MNKDIVTYMENETVKSRFGELMGNRNAAAYIASVMLAVANNDKLAVCTPNSIYISALRAATLHLSVDPNLGQAYLVPFKDKATLIVGYKGLYDMAVRTGKYRYINVGHLYEGETFDIDRLSGFGTFGGGRTGDKIIGYFGAFEMITSFAKTIYMSVDEIEAHAMKYSRNYNYDDSLWKKEHDKMCRKTVLRILIRKWGYIDPSDAATLEEIEEDAAGNDDNTVDGQVIETPNTDAGDEPPMSREQAAMELGFDAPTHHKANQSRPGARFQDARHRQ